MCMNYEAQLFILMNMAIVLSKQISDSSVKENGIRNNYNPQETEKGSK